MPWSTFITSPHSSWEYVLLIDGWPYWFFSGGDHSGVTHYAGASFKRYGLEIPGEFSQEVRPFAGQAQAGPLRIGLVDLRVTDDETSAHLLTREFAGMQRAYQSPPPSGVWSTFIQGTVERNALTMAFGDNAGIPALPFDLYVGLETVRVDSPVAGFTYNVTRGRYPAYRVGLGLPAGASAALARRHVAIAPSNYLASTVPTKWIDRTVCLYGLMRTVSGPLEDETQAQLLWSGRITRLDYEDADRWILTCEPATEMLRTRILPNAGEGTLRGIHFYGPADDRRLVWWYERTDNVAFESRPSTGGGVIPEAVYDTPQDFVDQFLVTLAATEGATGWALRFTEVNDPEGMGLFVFGENNGQPNVERHYLGIRIGKLAARVMGLSEGLEFTQNSVASGTRPSGDPWSTPTALVIHRGDPVARAFWSARASRIQLGAGQGSRFAATQSTLADAAVLVDNRLLVRYSGITSNRLDVRLAIGEDGVAIDRDTYVVRRVGEEDEIIVRQCYLSNLMAGVLASGIVRELLSLMTSTGVALLNGTDDIMTRDYGISIPVALVDTASFRNLEAALDPFALDRFWVVSEPMHLSDMMITEGKVLGFYAVMINGRIAVRPERLLLPGATALTLDEGNRADPAERSTFMIQSGKVINAVTIKHTWSVQHGRLLAEETVIHEYWRHMYDRLRAVSMEHRGLRADGDLLPRILDTLVSRMDLYGEDHPEVGRTLSRDLFTRIQPGDVVLVTDSGLPNTEGGRGVTARAMTVLKVAWNLMRREGSVSLLFDDSLSGPLCPSALITAFDAGTLVATVAASEFTDSGADVDWFTVGDRVAILTGAAASPDVQAVVAQRTINAIVGNNVTLSGAIGGLDPTLIPVYMTFDVRGTVVADQLDEGTWVAGQDNWIGAAADRIPGGIYR